MQNVAHEHAWAQSQKDKECFDQHSMAHRFVIDQNVLLWESFWNNWHQWQQRKIKIKKWQHQGYKCDAIKPYREELTQNHLSQDEPCSSESTFCLSKAGRHPSQGAPQELPQRPIIRALQKWINFENAASMAVDAILDWVLCGGNILTLIMINIIAKDE